MAGIELAPEAERELLEARSWYLAENASVARSFAEAVDSAFAAVLEFPDAWPKVTADERRYRLTRFPYAVIYRVVEGRVLVVAVAHAKRRPGYWLGR